MSIYTSEKVMPYVYMCIHKTTKQFYIGYREANTITSDLDLPKYKTSSKLVKPIFDEFDWYIVAEFFNAIDAYDFEQELIKENFNDELILNKHYYVGDGLRFKSLCGNRHSEYTKNIIRLMKIGKTHTEESKVLMSLAQKGKKMPIGFGDKVKISNANRFCTDDTRIKMSISAKARTDRKPKTPEERLAISVRQSGENNSFYGKKHTEETLKIISEKSSQHRHTEETKKEMATREYLTKVHTCPHCNRTGKGSSMLGKHFDKCKLKVTA